jgi:chaperone required for assembly of F1-ATPase
MKKHYKSVECRQEGPEFTILLDGNPAKTPLGTSYNISNAELAKAVAAEWAAQGDVIRKESMPLTQITCVALDIIAQRRHDVCADVLLYADTDLVCYRAGNIAELAQQQSELLDPVIAWAEERFGVAFKLADGIMPVKQPATNHAKLKAAVFDYDDWRLAALAVSVRPLGSLILALALVEGLIDARAAFQLAHLEELYETKKWGRDEEKEARMQLLEKEVIEVEKFLSFIA